MKAIERIDPVATKLLEQDSFSVEGLREFAANWPPVRDHIGQLHSAIARLKGEQSTKSLTGLERALEDLFDLLPADWAGGE